MFLPQWRVRLFSCKWFGEESVLHPGKPPVEAGIRKVRLIKFAKQGHRIPQKGGLFYLAEEMSFQDIVGQEAEMEGVLEQLIAGHVVGQVEMQFQPMGELSVGVQSVCYALRLLFHVAEVFTDSVFGYAHNFRNFFVGISFGKEGLGLQFAPCVPDAEPFFPPFVKVQIEGQGFFRRG